MHDLFEDNPLIKETEARFYAQAIFELVMLETFMSENRRQVRIPAESIMAKLGLTEPQFLQGMEYAERRGLLISSTAEDDDSASE